MCVDGYKHSKCGKRGILGKNPFLQHDMSCNCPVCNCVCSVKYKATDKDTIALNREIKKRQEEVRKKEDGGDFKLGKCCCCCMCVISLIYLHTPSPIVFYDVSRLSQKTIKE